MSKKILFFGLWYHDYTKAIIEELETLGHDVTYVDIQPRSFLNKVRSTLFPSHYRRWSAERHLAAIEASLGTRYDLILFLQTHQVSHEHLSMLREAHAGTPMVLYNWDALSNYDYLSRAPFFDRVYTFDRRDAETHGFLYLPLFCLHHMARLRRDRVRRRAIYTVGNIVNTKRYHAIRAFADHCREHGLTFRHYLKISPVVYARLAREGVWPRDVHFGSIGRAAFDELIETSEAVFDFANHQQSGQTMRTFENLCTGKKIITNNQWIRKEPFFGDDRIFCFEDLDFSGVEAFLDRPIEDPEATFPEYHIDSFVRTLVDGSAQPTGDARRLA